MFRRPTAGGHMPQGGFHGARCGGAANPQRAEAPPGGSRPRRTARPGRAETAASALAGAARSPSRANWDVPGPASRQLSRANQGADRFLVATPTSTYASVFMLATDQPALALGGYQGWDRILTPPNCRMVADDTVRFFQLGGGGAGSRRGKRATPTRTSTSGSRRVVPPFPRARGEPRVRRMVALVAVEDSGKRTNSTTARPIREQHVGRRVGAPRCASMSRSCGPSHHFSFTSPSALRPAPYRVEVPLRTASSQWLHDWKGHPRCSVKH